MDFSNLSPIGDSACTLQTAVLFQIPLMTLHLVQPGRHLYFFYCYYYGTPHVYKGKIILNTCTRPDNRIVKSYLGPVHGPILWTFPSSDKRMHQGHFGKRCLCLKMARVPVPIPEGAVSVHS